MAILEVSNIGRNGRILSGSHKIDTSEGCPYWIDASDDGYTLFMMWDNGVAQKFWVEGNIPSNIPFAYAHINDLVMWAEVGKHHKYVEGEDYLAHVLEVLIVSREPHPTVRGTTSVKIKYFSGKVSIINY